MEIRRLEEYELYLKKQLSEVVKDEEKLKIIVSEYMQVFEDGIKFGRGNLKVIIEG